MKRRDLGCVLALCTLIACTPIQPARGSSPEDAGKPPHTTVAGGAGDRTITAAGELNQTADTACSMAGARSCGPGNPSRQPLLCEGDRWRPVTTCNEGQRCDAAPGASQGLCVKIAKECVGRTPDEEFCDGSAVRVCSQGISSVVSRCGHDERCVEQGDSVACDCAAGAVKGNGTCQVAVSCVDSAGGCDSLTECSMDNGQRVCGPCPAGYIGAGDSSGCSPVLLGLELSAGALSPAFAPSELVYQVKIPLLQQTLDLTARAADSVEIEINGQKVANAAPWNTGALNLGEHTIALTLKGANGLNARYEVIIQRSGAEEARLQARAGEADDSFGWAVALHGDTLVVSASGDDSAAGDVNGDETNNGATESGAAHVFVLTGGQWQQQAYLKAPSPQRGDLFGASVAIAGDTVLVGSTRGTPYLTAAAGTTERPGRVVAFQRTGTAWARAAVIESPSSSPDMFGMSVTLDDKWIVIGAPWDSEAAEKAGAVYVLDRTADWSAIQKIRAPEPRRSGSFGWSVALEGETLLVGAPETTLTPQGSGAAFAYTLSAAGWELSQKIEVAGLPAGAGLGHSVALGGNRAAIGAPSPGFPHAASQISTPRGLAYVFERSAGGWQQALQLSAPIPRPDDFFGVSLALAGDNLLVGASGDSSRGGGLNADPNQGSERYAGAFYLYLLGQPVTASPTYVKATNPSSGALFGDDIAMFGDTIVAGAVHEINKTGAVYVFR